MAESRAGKTPEDPAESRAALPGKGIARPGT
jgi:hypothetical protein